MAALVKHSVCHSLYIVAHSDNLFYDLYMTQFICPLEHWWTMHCFHIYTKRMLLKIFLYIYFGEYISKFLFGIYIQGLKEIAANKVCLTPNLLDTSKLGVHEQFMRVLDIHIFVATWYCVFYILATPVGVRLFLTVVGFCCCCFAFPLMMDEAKYLQCIYWPFMYYFLRSACENFLVIFLLGWFVIFFLLAY